MLAGKLLKPDDSSHDFGRSDIAVNSMQTPRIDGNECAHALPRTRSSTSEEASLDSRSRQLQVQERNQEALSARNAQSVGAPFTKTM